MTTTIERIDPATKYPRRATITAAFGTYCVKTANRGPGGKGRNFATMAEAVRFAERVVSKN